jgi:hypothetical protein
VSDGDNKPVAMIVGAGAFIGAAVAGQSAREGVSWFVHQQPRDARSFELDLRPYAERW